MATDRVCSGRHSHASFQGIPASLRREQEAQGCCVVARWRMPPAELDLHSVAARGSQSLIRLR